MQQVADWLEKLGMSQYAQRFAENGISIAALRHLTDQDLREIGVLLGHRRIMLAAISEFARAGESVVQSIAGSEARLRDSAERRQVTVMFSDLVGSTALSARMDPEDLREIVSSYQRCVAETVRRLGGFVAKTSSSGRQCSWSSERMVLMSGPSRCSSCACPSSSTCGPIRSSAAFTRQAITCDGSSNTPLWWCPRRRLWRSTYRVLRSFHRVSGRVRSLSNKRWNN
jgi:hypothetical protein